MQLFYHLPLGTQEFAFCVCLLLQDTNDAKNRLESLCYDLRSRVDGDLSSLLSEDEESQLRSSVDGMVGAIRRIISCGG
jgi:hypothetical protein